jgi:prepilin-type N-terminal cleavage/methylation domain-containing protein
MNKRRTFRRCRRAFTLIEVLVCAALMVIAFLALVAAFGHDSVVTQRGEDVTVATLLADEIRNMALQMAFADVLSLDGATYNPAILSTGTTQGSTHWSQRVLVTLVSGTDFNNTNPPVGAPRAARVTVEVRSYGKPVVTQTYYVLEMTGVPYTDAG